ncbi:MAG TPA: SDR family NAD(P)-dependent oxidoreductase [Mycobacteriales bacterium]|nr:SDR family NAD(P)-dependent oxidoreductase [Mycobacteriales bacterium]
MNRDRPGKRAAVITGGSSGIGAAVAARLAAAGDQVLVADLRPPAGDLPYLETDVRDPQQVQAAFDAAEERFGRVNTAVLSAGLATTIGQAPESMDFAEYHRLVDVNVHGVVHGVRAASAALKRAGGGGIAVLASLAGITPAVGDPFYSMTKFAVVGLVRTLGPQLAADGIAFNAVCPGFVDTPMVDPLRAGFAAQDFPLIPVQTVVDVILQAITPEGGHGECWLIQPGHEPAPYRFRGVPGARRDGAVLRVPAAVELQ